MNDITRVVLRSAAGTEQRPELPFVSSEKVESVTRLETLSFQDDSGWICWPVRCRIIISAYKTVPRHIQLRLPYVHSILDNLHNTVTPCHQNKHNMKRKSLLSSSGGRCVIQPVIFTRLAADHMTTFVAPSIRPSNSTLHRRRSRKQARHFASLVPFGRHGQEDVVNS
jgi:hypothetical protein